MKRLLLLALLAAAPAFAALGILVSSNTEIIAGKMYWNCVYDVLGSRVSRLIPIDQGTCPPTINM